MSPIDLLGWFAAAVGTCSVLPQLLRLWRERTSAGISLQLWQFTVAAGLAWTVHGYMVGAPQMQIPNVLLTSSSLAVLWFVVRDRGLTLLPKLWLPVLLAAALVCLDIFAGPAVFGLVVAIPTVVGQVSQLRVMLRSDDLSGLSAPYLVVASVMQWIWFTWGVLAVEWAIIMCACILGVLATINLGYYAWRRLRGTALPARTESDEPSLHPVR